MSGSLLLDRRFAPLLERERERECVRACVHDIRAYMCVRERARDDTLTSIMTTGGPNWFGSVVVSRIGRKPSRCNIFSS